MNHVHGDAEKVYHLYDGRKLTFYVFSEEEYKKRKEIIKPEEGFSVGSLKELEIKVGELPNGEYFVEGWDLNYGSVFYALFDFRIEGRKLYYLIEKYERPNEFGLTSEDLTNIVFKEIKKTDFFD